MPRPSVVNRRACKSCPFRRSAATYFPVASLQDSVERNLNSGYAHNCHSGGDRAKVCAGFTRFVVDNKTPNRMLEVAERLGVFDPATDVDRTTDLVTESLDAVYERHAKQEENW